MRWEPKPETPLFATKTKRVFVLWPTKLKRASDDKDEWRWLEFATIEYYKFCGWNAFCWVD